MALTGLALAVACGHTGKSSTQQHAAGGEPSYDGGGSRPDASGGRRTDASGGTANGGVAGAEASDLSEAGATVAAGGESGGAAPVHEGGTGGASELEEPATAGAGGSAGASACEDDPTVVLQAPLAATSLVLTPSLDVALGQGFQTTPDPNDADDAGVVRERGCVTGVETNQERELGTGGLEVAGGGPATPGGLSKSGERSLSALTYAKVTYGASYLMRQEKRSAVADCGDRFVRTLVLGRAFSFSFEVTFPSQAERDTFAQCYLGPQRDITLAADPEPISRYLIAHAATLSISVKQTAGDPAKTQQILDGSQCSAAALPACAKTLSELDEAFDGIFIGSPDGRDLAEVEPSWGIVRFGVYPYFP